MANSLKDRAQGRWRNILPLLGIDAKCLINKHGPCPICKGGKDRFRFDDKDGRGTYICNHCGAGDGVQLVMDVRACDFKEAAQLIETVIGRASKEETKPKRYGNRDHRADNNHLWEGANPVTPSDPVGTYLFQRVGLTTFPRCLRSHTNVRYFIEGDPRKLFFPAMLAKVTAPDGTPATIHRTYLTREGIAAPLDDNKRLMPGEVPKGSAVRLAEYDRVLGITEGIETALSVARLFDVPCWAALSAGMLSEWIPPEYVEEVIVFSDNDVNFAGQAAAYKLGNRLVVKNKIRVRVDVPIAADDDWNDVWRRKDARIAA